ncbi:MAG: hypothetical protein SOR31_03700 [Parvimonas sp.]|uniref:hypothetical protein n=1 Tax=Parvimonas sp. TaxID=1944660 RepID=UPI002A751E78|nr:hypothetical protein [Parvimonas sp.]MDY3050721.1 hypothetical protein [Parvimonas sp.]
MKFKVFCKTFIVLILISSNIFLFNKWKDKQLVNKSTITEEEKKAEDNKDVNNNEEKKDGTGKKYIEDKNINTVYISGYNTALEEFITLYMNRKYNYDSLATNRKLEDFYAKELREEYLKNLKTEAHPKYDERSRLRKDIEINIATLDEKTFLVTTLHKKDMEFINHGAKTREPKNQNCIYSNTFIVVIENNRYKIQKDEEFTIENVRDGA